VSCVASVGGVSVEADAHRGEDKAPDPTSCSPIINQPSLVALAADFFDSIDPERTSDIYPWPLPVLGRVLAIVCLTARPAKQRARK
jgi:hypothetical protein